jgi:hypothetical protein
MELEVRQVVPAGIVHSWDLKPNSLRLDHWDHKGNNLDLKVVPMCSLLWGPPGMDCTDHSWCWVEVVLLVPGLVDCPDRDCN